VTLNSEQAPAVVEGLSSAEVTIGDLLRDPADRKGRLDSVPLLLARGDETILCPEDNVRLVVGDDLLFAGTPHARRELELTMMVASTASYVLFDRHLPDGLVWRKLSRRYRRANSTA
jgi:hypothetical protein